MDRDNPRRKTIILRPRRVDYPRKSPEHREEYAAEVGALSSPEQGVTADGREEGKAREQEANRTTGYVGLALGIASLFIWSILLGPAAIVLGGYAYARKQKTVGAWAIGLGILSSLSYLVLVPLTR
ncbi:hypothetical protein F4V43_03855 [Paenibacillus spiritus]|uniref:DUF4190 domain-containing protein n=1 Tax=Paenibacillus spiritus TaxID=2496557 RepID=A0A5J5GHY5_9BACL|nr:MULTISPECIES: hypothetical protein [Paenibacillus]KAA9007630.1 hypothetical protein F4V43_03855 [Paenibacillus spiritus]